MKISTDGSSKPIGRFAPSPTGPLHLGSLVTAVGSFLMARSMGGHWLLRMEDLDTPRVIPGMGDDILHTLEMLGLCWDGPVVYQSRREDAYRAALEELEQRGIVYPCGCSRAEIARSASAPHPGDEGPIYPGICRTGLVQGREPRSIRMRVNDEPIVFEDGVMGRCEQILSKVSGDFVIKRADGPFAYHLAVVVDDAESGVNQVVRGMDLLASTPRQIWLQRALGIQTPSYFHLPLVTSPCGTKLSKRDNAVSIASVRNLHQEGGKLLVSALRFLGQKPPSGIERAGCREVLEWGRAHFEPALIPRESAPFSHSWMDRGGD